MNPCTYILFLHNYLRYQFINQTTRDFPPKLKNVSHSTNSQPDPSAQRPPSIALEPPIRRAAANNAAPLAATPRPGQSAREKMARRKSAGSAIKVSGGFMRAKGARDRSRKWGRGCEGPADRGRSARGRHLRLNRRENGARRSSATRESPRPNGMTH